MAVAGNRSVQISLSGDVTSNKGYAAAENAVSPGIITTQTLASGNNTITVPVTGSILPTSVTIIPPAGNATAITFKGVNGDTGVRIHNTDPTSIGLHSSVTSFVLNAGASITGVRFIWV